jgi:pimeloyl-ACP methyl ester carboxylesterase
MGSRLLLLCAVLQALVCTAQAGDLARERRIWEQLDGTTRQGEAVTLKTGELEFLALHSAARTAQTLGAVILLHDRGANPDWREVIHPLRTRLPDHGWETLSIQLPLTAADAAPESYEKLIPEAFPRLAFAVDFLSQRSILNIVLVGHGLGGRTALQWLAQEIPDPVQACVAIGLAAERKETEPGTLNALSRIQLPVLDLYGSRDLGTVLHTTAQRAAAARKAENTRYRQLVIEGADHFFTGQQDQLVSRVRAWLAREAGGVEKNL